VLFHFFIVCVEYMCFRASAVYRFLDYPGRRSGPTYTHMNMNHIRM